MPEYESELSSGEIYVDPEHEEHSFDLPFWRDNKKLWALEVPVEEISSDELIWILDVPFWEDANGNIVIKPRDVMEDPEHYPEHFKRIQKSDTSYPLDIMKNKKGEWLTLDGLHRYVKLVMQGDKNIKVRKISLDQVQLTKKD